MWAILIGVCVEKYSESSKIVSTSKNWTYNDRINTHFSCIV